MTAESTEQWKNFMAATQETQSCTNANTVTSYRNENHLPVEAPMSSKSWIVQKSTEEIPKNQLCHKFKQYNAHNAQNSMNVRIPHKQVQLPQNAQKKPPTKPASEFQAIWNELHKKQVYLTIFLILSCF